MLPQVLATRQPEEDAMRRLAMMAAVLMAAAVAPSRADAQEVGGPARIAVVSAAPSWIGGGSAEAPVADARVVAPEAFVAVRRADRHTGVTLMVVGLAGVLTGLLVDESAITVAGAIVGGVGLFMYLH